MTVAVTRLNITPEMWSRTPRLGLETVSTSRLGLISDKMLSVSSLPRAFPQIIDSCWF